MAPQIDGKTGQFVGERLWEETLAELSFANVEEILDNIKA